MTHSFPDVKLSWLFIILFQLINISGTAVAFDLNYTCLPGIHGISPGVSLPRGDIFLLAGDKKDLYCHLNPKHEYFTADTNGESNFTVSDLVFKSRTGRILASEKINATSIKAVYTAEAGLEIDDVECMVHDRRSPAADRFLALCTQRIHVGFRPQNLTDFACISEDWHNLNCTWNEPVNPIPTKYHLRFIEPGIKAHPKDCPDLSEHHENELDNFNYHPFIPNPRKKPVRFCYLDLSTKPPYRQAVSTYTFYVNATNPLQPEGKIYKIQIDHYSIVKPGPAEAVNLTVVSSNQLLLEYKVSLSMTEFPPGLIQRVRYKDEYSGSWQTMPGLEILDPALDKFNLSLPGLKPYTNYTVAVQMISATADANNVKLWSDSVLVWARTNASLPAHNPMVNIGSFETLKSGGPTRTILVYWKQLEIWQHNGPKFTYIAWLEDNSNFVTADGDKSYVKISNLTNISQDVFITAENDVGHAANPTKVQIPQSSFIVDLVPKSVTKVWRGDGRYRVAWRHPAETRRQEVVTYTLFFCKDKAGKDRPYQCDGVLDWIEVEPTWITTGSNSTTEHVVQTYDLELPENDSSYQIAVSANTQYQSSGMFWTTCTVIHNRVESKLTSVKVTAATSTRVHVTWSLDCSDQGGVVYGYRIEYCINTGCINNGCCESVEVTANHEEYTLQGLMPFTDYQVGVRIKNIEDSYGQLEYQQVKTLPDRPGSAPLAVKALDLTAASVRLSWKPPVVPNGVIGQYQLHYAYYNYKDERVKERTRYTNETNIDLQDLYSYTRYEVNVTACTILGDGHMGCSSHAATMGFITTIGPPARPPPPKPKFTNSTFVVIDWNKDFQLGAPEALRWEIKILPAYKSIPKPLPSNLQPDLFLPGKDKKTSVSINLPNLLPSWSPDCQNTSSNSNSFEFVVRAVVLDAAAGNVEYTGEWSRGATADAYCTPATNWFMVVGVPIIVLISLVFTMCVVHTIWKYYTDKLQFFGEIGKELDAKLVIQADGMHDAGAANVSSAGEFEMETISRGGTGSRRVGDGNSGSSGSGSPRKGDGGGGTSGDSKDSDDSDTLLLDDANNQDQYTSQRSNMQNRQKSESESAASSYLTSGCDSLLSRGISGGSTGSQILPQLLFNKQCSVTGSSGEPQLGSTCSGYVSMTRTESDGSSSNNSSNLSNQLPNLPPAMSSLTVGGGAATRIGTRNSSGPNRPVSAGPTLPTVTSSSLLSALQSAVASSNGSSIDDLPVNTTTTSYGIESNYNPSSIAPLSGAYQNDHRVSPNRIPPTSGVQLQESRVNPGYSLVIPSVNTHSLSIASVVGDTTSHPIHTNASAGRTMATTDRPGFGLSSPPGPHNGVIGGLNMFTVTTPISPPAEAKLPEFTPPPDILPPLKSEIGGDCTPLVVAAGPTAANKLPSSKSLSNEKGCESVSNALTAPASRMTAESAILPPGSASTGYTNTAVLGSDSLSSSPTPPVVENGGSDNLTSFQPSSISQSVNPPSSTRTNVQVNPLGSPPNTQLPNHGQMLPPPSDDSRPPQQMFISQAQRAIPVCHNYISVQQVQQLRPLPNNSNYTRIETGLSSNLKSPDTDFESKPQMGIQQP